MEKWDLEINDVLSIVLLQCSLSNFAIMFRSLCANESNLPYLRHPSGN